jgi:hypothetical protein
MKPVNPEEVEVRRAVLGKMKSRLGDYRRGLTAKSVHTLRNPKRIPSPDEADLKANEQHLADGGEVMGADEMPHRGRDPEAGNHKTYPMPGNYAEGGVVEEAGYEGSEQPAAVEAEFRAQSGLTRSDGKRVSREDDADARDEGPADDEAEQDRNADADQDGSDDEDLPPRLRRNRKLAPSTDDLFDMLVSKKVAR